jgi:hypothetical protein
MTRLLPIVLAVLAALLLSAPARAGTYEHLAAAPPAPGADGWTPAIHTTHGYVSTGWDGALWAGFFTRGSFDPGESAEWAYAAPAHTTVETWRFERQVTGIGAGDWNTLFSAVTDGRPRLVAHDVPSRDRPWGRLAAHGLGADRVAARLVCGGPRYCGRAGSATMLRLRAIGVTLHDPHAPSVSGVQGDLARDAVLSGTRRLSFAAADRGAGVYRAFVSVDGTRRPAAVVDSNGGRCRDLVPGGVLQSAHRVPCAAAVGAMVALDTRAFADGRHTIAVLVEDAAGNVTTAYGPVTKTVANRPVPARPAPVPAPAPAAPPAPPAPRPGAVPGARAVVHAWLERRGRRWRALTAHYGERVRLRGRITDPEGRPLAGASLGLAERVVGAERPRPALALAGRAVGSIWRRSTLTRAPAWEPVTGVRARRDGRFTAFTRVGPSRRLRLTAAGGARSPVLRLRVRAPLTVRATRRGAGVAVRGRLRGRHVPRGGALVELQLRTRGRWVTRLAPRTDRRGRFAGRLASPPPGRILLRARAPRQPGLPYAPGTARARAVSPARTAARTAARTSR